MGRPQRNDRSDHTDKLAEAHRRLAAAVEALVSGDDWQRFLTMAAKLHGYSTGNHAVFEPSECPQTWCGTNQPGSLRSDGSPSELCARR